jgi:hypothetical protein
MRKIQFVPWAVLLAGCSGSGDTQGADATTDGTVDTSSGGGDTTVDGVGIDVDVPCGDARCADGEICIRGRCAGCCDIPPSCIPIPIGCASGNLACGCFSADPCGGCTKCQSVEVDGIHCGNCQCVCSAPWTPIDTPEGPRRIADLRAGDLVFSVHRGEKTIVPLARVGRRAVEGHSVVRLTLENGHVIEMSGGHPTADGRALRTLVAGDRLGEMRIAVVETVPYDEPFTHDVLPASDSGTYFSRGAWLGSTMHRSFERASKCKLTCTSDVGGKLLVVEAKETSFDVTGRSLIKKRRRIRTSACSSVRR